MCPREPGPSFSLSLTTEEGDEAEAGSAAEAEDMAQERKWNPKRSETELRLTSLPVALLGFTNPKDGILRNALSTVVDAIIIFLLGPKKTKQNRPGRI